LLKYFNKSCFIAENGRMKKQPMQLSKTYQEYLKSLISTGEPKAKNYRRALVKRGNFGDYFRKSRFS